ncbi:hypothetical protein B0H17DRAFT_1179222, partial [Mycena rosella]
MYAARYTTARTSDWLGAVGRGWRLGPMEGVEEQWSLWKAVEDEEHWSKTRHETYGDVDQTSTPLLGRSAASQTSLQISPRVWVMYSCPRILGGAGPFFPEIATWLERLNYHVVLAPAHPHPAAGPSKLPQSAPKPWIDPAALRMTVPGSLATPSTRTASAPIPPPLVTMSARATKFVNISIERSMERAGRLEATTIAELTVTKRRLPRPFHLLQG